MFMRAIMVMFDTLSRRCLETYGASWVKTPNFTRLEERCVVMDRFYCGSMPCMPARRELHTGRYNFMHRGWGPLEPFDCSAVQLLHDAGVYTHLVTDHSHYFEDGGGTYHNRYNTWEGFRGQEGDRWTPQGLADLSQETNPLNKKGESVVQHLANRTRMIREEEMPSVRTIQAGLDFLEHYHQADNWFLQVECFDPHEPFYVPEKYRAMYGCAPAGKGFYWPPYRPVDGIGGEDLNEANREYAALITMCDHHLGRILDFMDAHDMWKDTMLMVNTDHGFLLGEHGFMGKNYMPAYEEVSHIPFYIHDPRHPHATGRRQSLAQTVDISPTLLEFFGVSCPVDMDGHDLAPLVENDTPIRDTALFGVHGGHTCMTDGRYVLMQAPAGENKPLCEWTLMPTNMRGFYGPGVLETAELHPGNRFTNGIPCMKYTQSWTYLKPQDFGTLLFDLDTDPGQEQPLQDGELLSRMQKKLAQAMEASHAPWEEFCRLGLEQAGMATKEGEQQL